MSEERTSTGGTVSVVIPTIGRASLRACVESVHRQSVPTEIIVVLDAPQQRNTVETMLSEIPHVLLTTSGRQGGARARNIGMRASSGDFVAYLDDDDVWVDGKLTRQLAALARAEDPQRTFCLTSTTFVRAKNGRRTKDVVPRLKFDPEREHLPSYLVQREELRYGRRFMQSSSILGPSRLMRQVPWDDGLVKYQDWDLLCRLSSAELGISLIQLDEPLVTVYAASEESVSAKANWQASAVFYARHRQRMTRRARADFVWSHLLRAALFQRSLSGLKYSVNHLLEGRPHVASVVVGLSGVARH